MCKAGTYVSVSNKGAADLVAKMDTEENKKGGRFKGSSSKSYKFLTP